MIRSEWHMDAASAGAVQTAFNISNALALFAASWLSDYYGPRRIYLIFSWLGGIALLSFAIFAHSFPLALVLISFVGMTQGGAYTPAIMLAIRMHSMSQRGYAVGMVLSAGSLGYLLSLFISSWGAFNWGASAAFYLCAGCVLMGGVLSHYSLLGMSAQPVISSTEARKAGTALSKWNTPALLLLLGYIAHCWELLGSWTWTPALLHNTLNQYSANPLLDGVLIASAIHLSGMVSTLLVGTVSDYFNRTTVLLVMGGLGAVCSALTGLSASWGAGWTFLCVVTGSFFILGDSGVFSAAIADNVDPALLGRIMGVRSLLGFGIGAFSPLCFGIVLDASESWKLAYLVLASGGIGAFLMALILQFCILRQQR